MVFSILAASILPCLLKYARAHSQRNLPARSAIVRPTVLGNSTIILGNSATVLGNSTIILENSATVPGNTTTVLGNSATVLRNTTTVLGNTTTVLGNNSTTVSNIILGKTVLGQFSHKGTLTNFAFIFPFNLGTFEKHVHSHASGPPWSGGLKTWPTCLWG